jgi:xanthine dehydrogenase accessory factor
MFDEFLRKASELRAADCPFAVAIVVKYQPPVSGKPGDKAIIQPDGKVWGWIGGGCVQPLVIREALQAIKEGSPRIVHIAPSTESEPEIGSVNYTMSCHGGGALDVYIEPVLAKSRILIFGRSPAAQSLSRLGKAVGYGIGVVCDGATRELFPDADFIANEITSGLIHNGSETFIVVATQGERDEEALGQALCTDARYISFIASHAKAQKVIGHLAEKGASPQMLGRIKAPAGLSFGTSPQEIAVSIIAEIIQTQKRCPPESSQQEEFSPEAVSQSAIDPVCGMAVDASESTYQSEYAGKSLYFCCAGCKQTFDTQPGKFLQNSGVAEEGVTGMADRKLRIRRRSGIQNTENRSQNENGQRN